MEDAGARIFSLKTFLMEAVKVQPADERAGVKGEPALTTAGPQIVAPSERTMQHVSHDDLKLEGLAAAAEEAHEEQLTVNPSTLARKVGGEPIQIPPRPVPISDTEQIERPLKRRQVLRACLACAQAHIGNLSFLLGRIATSNSCLLIPRLF